MTDYKLTREEQETHLNMSADDHSTWYVYSDDPAMQRRIEAVGAVLVKGDTFGGKHYTLPANQITFRQPVKPLSDERKAQLGDHMRALRAAQAIASAKKLKNDAENGVVS